MSLLLCCLSADARIGKYYARYIAPYQGTYGAGSSNGVNRFWAIAGNHDVSNSAPLSLLGPHSMVTRSHDNSTSHSTTIPASYRTEHALLHRGF
jgi:hypothetical protein